MKITGALLVIIALFYAWFVAPEKDKWGRYTPKAFGDCLILITALLGGFTLMIL